MFQHMNACRTLTQSQIKTHFNINTNQKSLERRYNTYQILTFFKNYLTYLETLFEV
jgi:hypothetical protein